jgi:hypothetical protein
MDYDVRFIVSFALADFNTLPSWLVYTDFDIIIDHHRHHHHVGVGCPCRNCPSARHARWITDQFRLMYLGEIRFTDVSKFVLYNVSWLGQEMTVVPLLNNYSAMKTCVWRGGRCDGSVAPFILILGARFVRCTPSHWTSEPVWVQPVA